jgi:hypothetical protein
MGAAGMEAASGAGAGAIIGAGAGAGAYIGAGAGAWAKAGRATPRMEAMAVVERILVLVMLVFLLVGELGLATMEVLRVSHMDTHASFLARFSKSVTFQYCRFAALFLRV